MIQRIFLSLLLASLWSCGQAPPVPVDHFYRLTPSSASVEKRRLTEEPVYVAVLFAEGLYNDRALLFSSDAQGSELRQHHYYFWYTSPPRLLRDYLVQFMRDADVSPLIMEDTGMSASLRVSGKVIEFERRQTSSGSTAGVTLELRVDKPDHDLPILLRQYRASVDIQGQEMPDVISAFNTAVDRICGEFLGDLGTALHAP